MFSSSGFLQNPFDPRDVWEEELAGLAEPVELPKAYLPEKKRFEEQGSLPFCVAFSVTKLFEEAVHKATSGTRLEFSQPHLFFNGGGSMRGSNFRALLDLTRKKGCISYERMPMPKDIWSWDQNIYETMKLEAKLIPFDAAVQSLGYIRINPNPDSVRQAIFKYGAVMAGVAASGGYWRDRTTRPAGKEDNHAIVLDGFADDGAFRKLDSLQPRKDYDGYSFLNPYYEFHSVYAMTELPTDWKIMRDESRKGPVGNAERYGKPRNFQAELEFANKMVFEFSKFNNQSVLDAAGMFWEMYIRAGVYGDYSLSYTKWGQWQPGDLINDCYHWRRTGEHLFNFDQPRIK